MNNNNQQKQTEAHVQQVWTKAYDNLQEDHLLQISVLFLNRHEAGRALLEQARQVWQEHGLTAPFDVALSEAELKLKHNKYNGSRDYYQAIIK